ncbi:ABC-type enterochelin transport system%2C ATPase component [Serratia marcescens]|uniref:TrlF family AAA-like ATPase n=1 Tax=Serratia TaxID=613 RepID=UPI0007453E66|nr:MULTISPECIES: hypothetical protein [Serratia]CUY21858.1 ABC-type enterochelin transport system%2C ATPase component [Serratia marcescens]CUY40827.1 ABC-type enterochelin transport system%2C ATPase component [Serratia marcescens]CUY56899.1 ABC-type enterochelin transport system%2C ATPase component [Serratia marcescens]CUZ31562.1 ABC-type enterochelin transport system%2C ATPase component [Serratia marcescens]CUZ75020.1 ABC-type enterochelin transport system%2C ATPase component [Serratia marces
MPNIKYQRGSEWRKWDLHIHTPASFHWSGEKFDPDYRSSKNTPLIDEMIHALNAAEPAVFAIMDYWTFDGWFALKHRLSQPDAPQLEKTVFPGIELRLMAPMKGRLNAHVLFSDLIEEQELVDFKSNLKVEFPGQESRNLSNAALIEFARFVPKDKLRHHSLEYDKVQKDSAYALKAGSIMAELNCDSYKKAVAKVKNGNAIGFMPFDTNDGLTEIDRNEHFSYVLGLFKTSPIFETRNIALAEAFSGNKTVRNGDWFHDFQYALNNIPRLAISGSDAHCFVGQEGNNDRRGYGDYPSGKATWIKADPTYAGLKQAIKEPSKRSFIGTMPPKCKVVKENKSLFIDSIHINKVEGSSFSDNWLDGTSIDLNYDLVAIIGNKGSGKSALADITALLGNSKLNHHFSFLKANRFRGKTGEPAKHFTAKLTWSDDAFIINNLNENPAIESVELVKYIPQGHFEELCNAHVTGQSDAFENELRTVIFSHANESIRLGAHDFNQLIEQQERSLRGNLENVRGELHKVNWEIESVENQMNDEVRKSVDEQINQKQRLLDEHLKIKPIERQKPTGVLSPEQQKAAEELSKISDDLDVLKKNYDDNQQEIINISAKTKACKNIIEGLDVIRRTLQQFEKDFADDASLLGLVFSDIIKVDINHKAIIDIEDAINLRSDEVKIKNDEISKSRESFSLRKEPLNSKLNEPQQAYQDFLEQLRTWEEKRIEIEGNKESPDTLMGLKYRKEQLDNLPSRRDELIVKREVFSGEIFDILEDKRKKREGLFNPVQDLIQSNALIRDDYKLQFSAELKTTTELVSSKLFSMIKQASGDFRGESESISAIKDLIDSHDFSHKDSVLSFLKELLGKIELASKNQVGIRSVLRKDRDSHEVYDFIFGLEYLEPRYTLKFQDAQIEQLSPGQRGALLLIFYLLVDKGDMPIILDQPEENLDNETIVSLLVPVLTEAKHKRQIIMVTHNPNLAVVCDAEQIIHCGFDRRNGHKISYTSGSIECNEVNRKIVDVLEGTMPAFNNRRLKYH